MATIAGFGEDENGEIPAVLQEGQVPIVRDEVAAEAYPYAVEGVDQAFGGFEPDTQLGAGYPQGGTDTCQGDSGGPLLVPGPGGFRLVGDTSYGAGCGDPGFPGIYGRLADDTLREWVAGHKPAAVSTAARAKKGKKAKVTRAERRRARRAPARFRAARAGTGRIAIK
jgi:secreted trypsin-like serine protease